MKTQWSKAELTYQIWKNAALSQLANEDTFIMGVGVGLYQGLKYNGSLIRGIKAGVGTMAIVSVAAGVMNVLQLRSNIKKASESK